MGEILRVFALTLISAAWIGTVAPATNVETRADSVDDIRIVFERGGDIWMADADGTNQLRVAIGRDPEVSPDGRRLVYTRSGEGPQRTLIVRDLSTGDELTLSTIPSDNCYGARWSPDSQKLMFHMMHPEYFWVMGEVSADNSSFALLGKDPEDPIMWGSSGFCWGHNAESVIFRSFDDIREYSLAGDLLNRYAFSVVDSDSVFTNYIGSITLSRGGERLLLEVDDEPGPIALSLIVVLDMRTGEVRRASPRTMIASDPAWFPDGQSFAFSGCDMRVGVRERGLNDSACEQWSIYRHDFSTGETQLLIQGAYKPSVGGGGQ